MKDLWEMGDSYDYFMGRWSTQVAEFFLEWLSPLQCKRWLDVGCGTGALSDVIMRKYECLDLIAIDRSESFVNMAQQRLGEPANCQVGDALSLSFLDSKFDYVVSGLVLNFIDEPVIALREMKKVTFSGGLVAFYVWDYTGEMEFLKYFWDAAMALDPSVSNLNESSRFSDTTKETLQQLLHAADLINAKVEAIEIETNFVDFNDYWTPFLGGQGPAPSYVNSLNDSDRKKLKEFIYKIIPINKDGSISLKARAWAAKCIV